MSLKDQYAERAEEIAQERYECGFYDLTPELRDKVWAEAEGKTIEDLFGMVD